MAKYPAATWRPVTRYLPGGSSAAATSGQRRLILHTAVTGADSLFNSMNTPGTPTSHFYLDRDGHFEQYIDTAIRSSANLDGNGSCITVETWDGYPAWSGSNVPPWTPAQVEALARLAVWCHTEHGIPLERLPSSLPGTTGVGWHRLGIDGNFPAGLLSGRVSGGERWSSSAGKVCPGDQRIVQVVNQVLPRAAELLRGNIPPPAGDITEGDTDMPLSPEDLGKIKTIVDGRVDSLQSRTNEIAAAQLARERAQMGALRGQIAKAKAAVDALPAGATKAEVKGLLESIDATIVLKVNETETPA